MKRKRNAMPRFLGRVDPFLLGFTTLLTLISLVTILGAIDNFGKSKLVMQLSMSLVGILVVFVLANLDYRFIIDRLWLVMLIFSIGILAITLIFGVSGTNIDTANRSWLKLTPVGPTIQPSEFVKFTFICTFAKHLELVGDRINKPKQLLLLLVHAGAVIGLILASGDLGVAIVYIGIFAFMLFCSGLSLWYFLAAGVILMIAFPILWENLAVYQKNRIVIGFSPELDPYGYGMQPLMSKEAIMHGGLWGKGWFSGGVYEDLVASHTDFIFATICEKFGVFGGVLVIVGICGMVIRILVLANKVQDRVGKLICCGVAVILILQTLENVGMCLAVIPVVGITLPFLSYGGSSMLALYMIIGLVHSVAAKDKKYYFRYT